MLYSGLFGKTIKTVPSDLAVASHKLLHQGGFIRQISTGRYAILPLGFRVWKKIIKIIDEEMEVIGSQRLETPILHPIEIWQATNRDKAFGNEMHIIEDHHGATFAVSATAEGLMVELAKQFKPSYKDLPLYIHQFIRKFRDEKRPKGGLIRVREFVMKDAYSFDVTESALYETYQRFFNAYKKIAEKMDLKVIPVLSDSGAIGGDYNHEFLVESDAGEAYAFLCDRCDYATQIERAEAGFEQYETDEKAKEVKEYWDDTVVNCELLAQKMEVPMHTTTKTILFKTSNGDFVAAMVRGDYSINETKLKNHLAVDKVELASEEEIYKLTGAKVGFAGPVGLPKNVIVVADLSCKNRTNFEAGGNKTGLHLCNLNFDRDFPTPAFADIREVKEGDACQACGKGKLKGMKGIEWGHCFKLDLFYSKPQNGTFTDKDGAEKNFWMGSYGIGVERSMAAVVETHHDRKGIVWPESIAPYAVHLIGLNMENEDVRKNALAVYEKLEKAGVETLLDNRENVSAGEKFSDADLIGCPLRAVISEKTKGKIEIKKRSGDKIELVDIGYLIKLLTASRRFAS